MTNILIFAVVLIIGILYGFALGCGKDPKADGRFISLKDEDGNYVWKLDLDFDPKELPRREYVIFKVYNIDENNVVLKSRPIMQKNKKGDKKDER